MNEKYLHGELAYVPKRDSFIGMAAIHLAFQPSDELEQSLLEFVKPEARPRFKPLLISNEVTRLHYTGGDTGGMRYMPIPTLDSPDSVSDRDWLQNYKREINLVKSQSVPVAAYRPRLERIYTGAMIVELALLPGALAKRKFGKSLLRHLRIMPSDDTPDEVIYARTLIPKSKLVDNDAIRAAQVQFMAHLGVNEDGQGVDEERSHESPKNERMFVTTAFINERIIS
ncbi:MAG: hypothetical protein JWM07_139 [Candidatus Saccharibacteria bacterium]|nr:hypothetical protein [Candidatus Saccharibacteria bacterium]